MRILYFREIYYILSLEIFIFKKMGDNLGEIDILNGMFYLELLWFLLLFIFNVRCYYDVLNYLLSIFYLFLDLDFFIILLIICDLVIID